MDQFTGAAIVGSVIGSVIAVILVFFFFYFVIKEGVAAGLRVDRERQQKLQLRKVGDKYVAQRSTSLSYDPIPKDYQPLKGAKAQISK